MLSGSKNKWNRTDMDQTNSHNYILIISNEPMCNYVLDAFRLQTQQPLPHEQQFGGEVWDALDPQHEVTHHLKSPKITLYTRPQTIHKESKGQIRSSTLH